MGRALIIKLVLAGLLAALLAADSRLEAEERARRAVSVRVERLLPMQAKKDAIIAALVLKRGQRELLYARSGGVWRCRDVFGAVADWRAIQGLVDMLLDAEGTLQTDVTERFADYGIGTEQSWHVSLHGPGLLKQDDRDVFFDIELGDSLPTLGGGFVRMAGESVVRVIERDPRALINPLGMHPEATPLLDPHLVPGVWLAPGDQLNRVQVDRIDGVSYALELRSRELSPEHQARGVSPVQWVLAFPDGREQVASPDHAIAYTVFLSLVRWSMVLDPDRAEELGMQRLSGRVLLGTKQAAPMLLAFGPASRDELVPVANDWAKTLLAVPKQVGLLCLPRPEELLDAAGPNPWEPWLVEASRAMLEAR
ncbi:MAG: hypothetical protein DRQ55_16675 [Planctomycetota bacterium]|nr:MAG: hypothetical protein DRQ55_16675 [Planctomycetota bacterium]